MKKKMIFVGLLAIVATVSSYAQYVTQDGFVYIDQYGVNDDFTTYAYVVIIDYTGKGGAIIIPPSLMGQPPAFIAKEAFFKKQLTSVTIPNGLILIGKGAFHTNRLTNIIIPDSVIEIRIGAFMNNRLTSVTIGKGVTKIESMAFYNNPITSITIGNGVNFAEDAYLGYEDEDGKAYRSNFVEFYNAQGRIAGTYTRPNARSTNWTRK
jgi:hypothetical protein